jgi:RNA polymerase-binding transcription factor DksA
MNIEKQKDSLLLSRADVVSNVDQLRSNLEITTNADETGSESDIPTHDADSGTALFDRERDESMLLDFEGRLEEIDRALQKIAEGTYGVCDRDGKIISPERLLAIPEATLCIECQAMEEIL